MIEVDVINNNDSQTIIIPESLNIKDSKVYLKKTGDTIHIIPFHNPWQSMIDSLSKFTGDFLSHRQQDSQKREELD